MVNFSNIGTTTAANAKSGSNSGETATQSSGFAALFAALKPEAGQLEQAPSAAQLQQLANKLNSSEREQLLEDSDLSPQAIAHMLSQLAAQLNSTAATQQHEPTAGAQQQITAALTNTVRGTNGQPLPATNAQAAGLNQATTDTVELTAGPLLHGKTSAMSKTAEPPVFTTPVANPNAPQTDVRVATPLAAELKPVDHTTPIDTTRPSQAPLAETLIATKPVPAATPTINASVVMIDAPTAQAAQAAPATPSTTAATASLAAPVGSQAWASQLQQNVLQMVMHNQNEMTLRLHPAELGPLQVQLRMDDSTAQLNILTHSQQVRGALEQALPTLREALANQGIQLGESNVNDQGQQFAQQQARQQAQQWAATNGQNNAQNNDENTVESSQSAENTDMGLNSRHTAAARDGQVDTFA